jgi:hypothetical protein
MKKLLFSGLFLIAFSFGLSAQTAPNPDVSETVFTNTRVTLSVTADGTAPITYTWFKNNVQVATGTSLVFNSIQTADAGTYKVVASNTLGSSDSNNAILVVIVPVAPSNVKIIISKG